MAKVNNFFQNRLFGIVRNLLLVVCSVSIICLIAAVFCKNFILIAVSGAIFIASIAAIFWDSLKN
ncbi:MAG: hypothetical protein IJE68_04005 [Clostridia bacterium]|nr:hypothetical protein [Clostridia bacterium]